jgi:predicted TIM-barrel fold metal-dependent hydrolase
MRDARAQGSRGAWLTMTADGTPLHHPDYEDFWAAAAELEMPISLHIDPHITPFTRAMPTEHRSLVGIRATNTALAGMALGEQLGHLIFSGVFDRYPKLRVVLAESGVGWISYVLDRMDDVWIRVRGMGDTRNERLPSEIASAQVYATFERDQAALLTRELWGVDNIMWASDYPHMFSTFPESQAAIEQLFGGVSAEEKHKMVCGNVAELYQLA